MASDNGKRPGHTDRVRELARYIADQPDEISEVTENHFHLPKGTTLEADATGRLKAVSVPDDDRDTPTDPPRQPPVEPGPKSGIPGLLAAGGSAAAGVIRAASTPWGFGALLLLVAAFVAWLRLRP